MRNPRIENCFRGHSSEIMFLNYIGKSNKDMALELKKYF
jgi:hypothetical protein